MRIPQAGEQKQSWWKLFTWKKTPSTNRPKMTYWVAHSPSQAPGKCLSNPFSPGPALAPIPNQLLLPLRLL